MSLISWVLYTEPVVGKNHPTLPDVDNRPLRQFATALGFSPDADSDTWLLGASKMGTGTADSTKFLRGDRTWQVPPAGSAATVWRSFVTPNLAGGSFAWVNQGTATITDDATYVSSVLYVPGTEGTGLRIRKKTAPATPYNIYIALQPTILANNFNMYGLLWRDSASGKIVTLRVVYNGGDAELTVSKWDSATAFNSTYTTISFGNLSRSWGGPLTWLRIRDDGATRYSYISSNGLDWILFHSVGRTDFLTPNEVGVFSWVEGGADTYVRCWSWEQTA